MRVVVLPAAVLAVLGATRLAAAQPAEAPPPDAEASAPSPNRFNVRLGGASTDSVGRPQICVDVRVVSRFGVETCGTGAGVIHDEPGTEMVHFRGTWSLLDRKAGSGFARLRAGAGFAELQVGVDRPGFQFGSPDTERGAVAGPEAVVQGQWLAPIGAGVEAIASFTAGVAMFARADELIVPQRNVQPFISFEIGVGW